MPITNQDMTANVTSDVNEKYDRFMLKQFCQENPNCRACPHCNEWFAEIPQESHDEPIWKKVECGGCHKFFCGKCGQEPHKGQQGMTDMTCEVFAKWQVCPHNSIISLPRNSVISLPLHSYPSPVPDPTPITNPT